MIYLKNYIYYNKTFNNFIKYISNYLSLQNIDIKNLEESELIELMNMCDISYKIENGVAQAKLSKFTNIIKYIFEITFLLVILLFTGVFICMYYNLL